MSQIRKFHLNDLPKDKIYVYLNNDFREKLFRDLYLNVGGSTILSRIIKKVKNEEIRRWKVGKRAIPLWALVMLNVLLKNRYSIHELERNIIGYKSRCSTKVIKNPVFPILEDERLARIVTHLICDGYDGGKRHPPVYSNTEELLVQNFEKDLGVFGDVPVRIRKRGYKEKNWKDIFILEFPRVFTFILRYLYKINFGSKVSRLPKKFFNLPNSLKFQVIKAFADDESRVSESRITFISSNKLLLEDLKKLIAMCLKITSKDFSDITYVSSAYAYNFDLKRSALNLFYKFIDYTHTKKKILLESIINRKSTPGNKYKEGEAQKIILNILSEKPSSAVELSLKIGIKGKNVRYHLYKLKKLGKVVEVGRGLYHTTIWGINNVTKNTLYE